MSSNNNLFRVVPRSSSFLNGFRIYRGKIMKTINATTVRPHNFAFFSHSAGCLYLPVLINKACAACYL